MFWIGPVIMQPFPDATGALSNVGIVRALLMHLEVLIGAITEELLAARTEVGEPGDELFGRRRGRQFEVNCGHICSFDTRVCPAKTPLNPRRCANLRPFTRTRVRGSSR